MKVHMHGTNYYVHGTKRHPSLFDWDYSNEYTRQRALKFMAARADQGVFAVVGPQEVLTPAYEAAAEEDWVCFLSTDQDRPVGDEMCDGGEDEFADEADEFEDVLPVWGDTFDPADIRWGFSVVDVTPKATDRVRLYDLARELDVRSGAVLDACYALGVGVRSHSSTVEPAQADRVRHFVGQGGAA